MVGQGWTIGLLLIFLVRVLSHRDFNDRYKAGDLALDVHGNETEAPTPTDNGVQQPGNSTQVPLSEQNQEDLTTNDGGQSTELPDTNNNGYENDDALGGIGSMFAMNGELPEALPPPPMAKKPVPAKGRGNFGDELKKHRQMQMSRQGQQEVSVSDSGAFVKANRSNTSDTVSSEANLVPTEVKAAVTQEQQEAPEASEAPESPEAEKAAKNDHSDEPDDPTGAMSSEATDGSLTGGWTDPATWKNLWHQYQVLFWVHFIAASVGTVVSVQYPMTLLIVLVVSGLLWPFSLMFGLDLWEENHAPLTADWWMTFIKWIIVDAAAAVPVLVVKGVNLEEATVQRIGDWIYIVLGANIVWTMLYKVDGWVRFFNTATGFLLVVALTAHCVAVRKHGKDLIEMRNGFPYGRGTPVSWLFCYTFWNAMFLADYSIQMTMQDFLFWGMMFGMQWLDPEPHTIDLYFCFARPVQLGIYIPIGCWAGIIPLWKDAQTLEEHTPLDINGHAFFLFIVMFNFLLSLACTAFAFRSFILGFPERSWQRSLSISKPDVKSAGESGQ